MKKILPELNAKGVRARSRFILTAVNFLALLFCFFVLRVVLFCVFRPQPPAPGLDVLKAFAIGLHYDVFVALALTLPLIFWLALLPDRRFRARWHRIFFQTVFFLFWFGQVFLFFAEYYFFDEFKSRFNTVAVDYLIYPTEVAGNIWDSYPVVLVVSVCGVFAVGLLFAVRKLTKPVWDTPTRMGQRMSFFGGALALCIVLWFTLRTGEARFSNERVINEIAGNGTVAFVNAAWSRNLDYAPFYRTMPLADARQCVRRLLTETNATFVGDNNSIQRSIAGSLDQPKYNVVVLLEESLGSEFWGSLGRTNGTLTPEMDRLATEEGMLFTNIYASGNRTVRGFEGVLSSFPPLPGDSIVKRDRSDNVETLARILKRDGYSTIFLYGGRGLFDGMRAFAMDNGYDRFVEQKHFDHPTFTTIWGVCDEDLYDRAIDECRALEAAGKPFFATVLSVSNHKPYTYPKGRILEDPDQRKRDAVKYTDYALGRFFKQVKNESFYSKTIFVVVADHGARVYGSQDIPIHSYEIPLVILGPAVVKGPSRLPQLGCSLDVAPTILGLLGRPYQTMFFGRDLLNSPPEGGRVLINHNRDIGIFRDDRLVVLGMNKTVEYYHGNPKAEDMHRVKVPDATDLEMELDATALYQVADDLYMHEHYRVQIANAGAATQ